MKIVVIGTRGIPRIQGGIETHCEELYPRIVAKGHYVTVIRRKCYLTDDNRSNEFRGVNLCDVYAPRKKSFEAIVHTFLAVLKARRLNPDILHVHAIGPSIMVPFARLLGMKVVMTNHGPDYFREKWGKMAKLVLRTGERWGTHRANRVIVISRAISEMLYQKYGRRDTELIFNGVNTPTKSVSTEYIESLGLCPGKYVMALGRFVPEKGFHDLIDAFSLLGDTDYKLVIAGDCDHPDEYSESLKRKAREAGVVLPGFIKGEKLNQIASWASLFVLPSYHEGLPIALLEAMSYGIDVIVSDIPANTITELTAEDTFPVGNIEALAERIKSKLDANSTPRVYNLDNYNWDNIADATLAVYQDLIDKKGKRNKRPMSHGISNNKPDPRSNIRDTLTNKPEKVNNNPENQ